VSTVLDVNIDSVSLVMPGSMERFHRNGSEYLDNPQDEAPIKLFGLVKLLADATGLVSIQQDIFAGLSFGMELLEIIFETGEEFG
jgi:hypothetical protein